jgi:mRNA-degrading endonuclease RelE of RelBE toxin-antitoxin system
VKSATLPSFWKAYRLLDASIRQRARKAFELWQEDPFYPSLHFKCINTEENIWSARITLGYRVLGIWEGDTVIWFWIGGHDEYEQFFG